MPSLEKVLLTATGSEATFHALRVARAATGRRHVIKFQGCYHGWHDSVAMNVISPAERVGQKDPLSQGILPEVLDATIVLPLQRRRRGRARARASTTSPRSSSSRSRTTSARCCRSRGSSRGCASSRPQHGHRARLRRGDHGLPPRARRLPGDRRRHARPDHARQGDGERLPDRRARRPGRPDGAVLDRRRAGPRSSPAPTTATPRRRAAALATIEKLEREPVHEHVFRLGERARTELQALYDRLGVPAVVTGFGSVFVSYFLEGPVRQLRRPAPRTTSTCSSATAAS